MNYKYVKGSDWLLHEAFCLFGEADTFKPYEKHHSTVKEACGKTGCAESVVVSYRRDTSCGEKEVVYRGRTAVLSWKSVCAG